ncbi:LytTR family transcriptional regulator DNA-binding domain-containing protein [Limosilactobacillus reuteri]|nr:LytTR family transcriptional regulator DNA-binding domain-containing protein [Limosilactobacillus reuteri]MCC4393072.1 LytTR family transcriptional regulator DNA-binding domain-containing protein [Limosilactobacillus reuteri]
MWTLNKHKIISRQTLTNIYDQLKSPEFLQIHRSFIVNLNGVTELQPSFNHTYELTLIDGSKLPVSRSYVNTTKKHWVYKKIGELFIFSPILFCVRHFKLTGGHFNVNLGYLIVKSNTN